MAVAWRPFAGKGTCDAAPAPAERRALNTPSHDDSDDLSLVIVGHVDHGKSTIIGRLLADTGSLPQGKLEQVMEACRRSGQAFEYAFLLDALRDERAQGITIDAARAFFRSGRRNVTIIDAPGHVEFLKNMVTGAARAEAALLVIDAAEGIQENSKRHGYLLSLLGVGQIAVLINKMDLVGYDEGVYRERLEEYDEFLRSIGVQARAFLPVSGRHGENIARRSERMPWYSGPTLLEVIDGFRPAPPPRERPFRMPVQGVYRFSQGGDTRRIVAGTVESGSVAVGDAVVFYPSGKRSRVKSIEAFNVSEPPRRAQAGQATGFTLEEQIYIRRGEVATLAGEPRPKVASRLFVRLFWLGKRPLVFGRRYFLKLGTAKVEARLEAIHMVLDAATLEQARQRREIDRHEVAECTLRLAAPVACDTVDTLPVTARFVLVDEYEIAGGGLVLEALPEAADAGGPKGRPTPAERARHLGQRGAVVWFTGAEPAAIEPIATEVEGRLVRLGRAAYLLSGAELRRSLSQDLAEDAGASEEHLRRIAEVAALFQNAGLIALVVCDAPLRRTRAWARERAGDGGTFLEVYVKAKPRAADAPLMVQSTFEEPEDAELTVDSGRLGIVDCAEQVVAAVLSAIEEGGATG